MVEVIIQPLAEFILQGFVQVLCYFIAKWTIPLITLGRVEVGNWRTDFPHRKWWGNSAYIRLPNGKISIEPELASLLGLMLLIPLSILAVLIYSHIKKKSARDLADAASVGWAKRSVPTADLQFALTLTWAQRCALLPPTLAFGALRPMP